MPAAARPCTVALLVLLPWATSARGQADEGLSRIILAGETAGSARRLVAADKLAGEGQLADAIDEYQRILHETGDDLVPASANDPRHLVPARWRCHLRLAALPADALRTYRDRIDGQAQKWLEAGAANHDTRLLRRVVEEAFCSRHTPKALDLLGDLAFERGAFDEAERWWRLIVSPLAPKSNHEGRGPAELVCPDPQIDVARVRAKQLLARLFRGEQLGLADRFAAFRAGHGDAAGTFAGRTGKYTDILQALAAQQESLAAIGDEKSWPTFAGDPSRSLVLPRRADDPNRLNRLVAEGPRWRFHLESRAPVSHKPPGRPPPARVLPFSAEARSLAFYPVIVGERVLAADARYLTAFDVRSGKAETWFDALPHLPGFDAELGLPAKADLRYSLTVADGAVFARFGAQELRPVRREGSLLCRLDLEPNEKGRRLRWLAKAPVLPEGPAFFEGAPAVRDGRVYVAVTHFAVGQATTAIYCYSSEDSGEAEPLWKRDVCAAPPANRPESRTRHHLLTLAGPTVVFCSHSGVIVAVDAATGRRAWAVRYPSRAPRATGETVLLRDLAPAVSAEGRLYVAPEDDTRLLSLDPLTGSLLWQRDEVEAVHLLGVNKGRLIFTTSKGIRAVNAADGSDAGGWYQRGSEFLQLRPFGRGLLAGDLVLWPNEHSLCVLSQEDGEQPSGLDPSPLNRFRRGEPSSDVLGNLAYANGCLVVAGTEELAIYVAPAAPPAEPGQGPHLSALARAAGSAVAAGQPARAVEVWQHALMDEKFRQTCLEDEHGSPLPGTDVAVRRIDELVRRFGPAAYADIEQQANAVLAAAAGEKSREALEKVIHDYPNSKAATMAFLRLARLHEEAGRPGTAAQAYRLYFRRADSEAGRVAARAGLARVYEKQGASPSNLGEPADRVLALPLARAWETNLGRGGHFLTPATPDDEWSLRFPAREFGAEGTRFFCRDPVRDQELWSRRLPGRPCWLCRHVDTLLVAGPAAVCCLRWADGEPVWQFQIDAEPTSSRSGHSTAPLSAFQLRAGRLFLVQSNRRLLCLDAETGQVVWQRWCPSGRVPHDLPVGRFLPDYYVDGRYVLIQATTGKTLLLAADNGRLLHDLADLTQPWSQHPLPCGEQTVYVVPDNRRVALLDLAAGKPRWTYEVPGTSTRSGEPPQVFGDGDRLFIIVPRNFGYGLMRLDPANGKPLWPAERFLGTEPVEARHFAHDADAVYSWDRTAGRGTLRCRDARTSAVRWEKSPSPLDVPWRTVVAPPYLIVLPAVRAAGRFPFRLPASPLRWELSVPLAEYLSAGFPVLLVEKSTGQVVQRLNLTSVVSTGRLRLAGGAQEPTVEVTQTGRLLRLDNLACEFRSP